MPHAHYLLDDFLLDESFQAFAAGTDAAAASYWQAWLAAHPAQQAAAGQAQELLRGLSQARPVAVPAGLAQQELRRFQQARQLRPAPLPRLRSQRWLGRGVLALASVLVLAGLGWWRWAQPTGPAGPARQYAAARQHRTITLPDGSVVTLNDQATLTTAATWTAETPREVWLTGEGYFRVAHRAARPGTAIADAPAPVKFVVHAGGLAISVLGTEFNVNSQPAGTQVVLATGKVDVVRQTLLASKHLLMQPGDLVETSPARPDLSRRRVRPALYQAWTQGRLEFQQTPVRDIVQLLRDAYGLQVLVADSAILTQQITGDVPATNLDVLLPALAKSLDIKVSRSGNVVRLAPVPR